MRTAKTARTSSVLWLLAGMISAFPAGAAWAQTSYPMITHTTPVALQRGKTTEVTVEGQMDFSGVYKALFEGDGITAEVIQPPQDKGPATTKPQVRSVQLRITVASDAALGVREFRVVSSLGVSSTGQLVVVED